MRRRDRGNSFVVSYVLALLLVASAFLIAWHADRLEDAALAADIADTCDAWRDINPDAYRASSCAAHGF